MLLQKAGCASKSAAETRKKMVGDDKWLGRLHVEKLFQSMSILIYYQFNSVSYFTNGWLEWFVYRWEDDAVKVYHLR